VLLGGITSSSITTNVIEEVGRIHGPEEVGWVGREEGFVGSA
jgi:hypothetical protein